jgi:hypothetical protein
MVIAADGPTRALHHAAGARRPMGGVACCAVAAAWRGLAAPVRRAEPLKSYGGAALSYKMYGGSPKILGPAFGRTVTRAARSPRDARRCGAASHDITAHTVARAARRGDVAMVATCGR